MTPEPRTPTTPATAQGLVPPPGCPAHTPGGGAVERIYGPGAADLSGLYEKLRAEHGPVAPVLLHDDVPMWVVLGHAENLHMVRTPSLYTRDSRIWSPLLDGRVKPDHPLMPHIAWQPIASHAEGDEHLRLRGAVTGAMSTIDHRSLRRHINRHTQRLVNRFCERGTADLVSQFTEHLPMGVMCEILGMPDEYGDELVHAARDTLKGTETAIASHAKVMEALSRLTGRRRAAPQEDFTSYLIRHPAGLTDDEVREHLRLVLLASYEATVNLLSSVLRMVLTDPRFRARLNGGQMTVPEAVEQSLWDEPPFSTVFAYFAKQDTELGGKRIKRGDGLLFAPQPGNIDPRVRPDLSAHMQGNRSHLAFGGGPHECPGQDIGRAIADVGVDALLLRLPDVELDCPEGDLRWTESIASRHLVALPVVFAPTATQDIQVPPAVRSAPPRPVWEISTQRPEPITELRPTTTSLKQSQPQPQPTPTSASAPAPVTESVTASASASEERPSAWRRLVRWWRGE
ncbi:cytochrome P450 [Streptomyces sp. NPDC088789]|uniref:cytochrome P450 n=1 Tax=Streptomyces sp. NPDC088789 TaxID=3365899 RepID=UPI003829E4FE